MNPSGQLIYEESNGKFKGVYTHKLNLEEYSKGIYFVQFVTDSQIVTKKIVLN